MERTMKRSLPRPLLVQESLQQRLSAQRLSASRCASVIYNFPWKNHVVGDLKVKVSEDQTEAEVVLPGFAFGDLNRFDVQALPTISNMFFQTRILAWEAGLIDLKRGLRKTGHTFIIGLRSDFVRTDVIGCHSHEDSSIVVELNGIGKTSFSTVATLNYGNRSNPVIKSTLFWVYLNKESRKKEVIPDWFVKKYSHPIRNKKTKILSVEPATEIPEHSRRTEITLKSEHIDHNGHLNNYYYIEFACDEIGRAMSAEDSAGVGSVRSLQVTFLQECLEGDELSVFTWRDGTYTWFSQTMRRGFPASCVKVVFYPVRPSAVL